jgi:hypothetical protein
MVIVLRVKVSDRCDSGATGAQMAKLRGELTA